MDDIEYKASLSSFELAKEKFNDKILECLCIQNESSIDTILINLTNSIVNQNQDEVLSALNILKQKKEHDFTLQVVKYFQLFEKLIFLFKIPDEKIQYESIVVIELALNYQTIQHSIECNLISFLIDVINSDNKSTGFVAIQSLSKIASYNSYCHDKVIFHLASLDVLQDFVESKDDDSVRNVYIVTECVEKVIRGKKRYVTYQTPGILPEENDNIIEKEIEKVQSFQNQKSYIQFTEDEKEYICIPSLNLISSLLKFELHPSIISFCLDSLVSLIPISNDYTLVIILNALCLLSKQKSDLWNEAFQQTNPSSWIAPLFQSDIFQKSVKIAQFLMFFVSNVIKQGVIIEGMPFDLLINNLQYNDEKSIVATYAAASIDSMLKIHNSLIKTFIQHNLLSITYSVYPNLSFSAKALIVSYLTRICQFGLVQHKRMIIEMNMVSFLVDVLLTNFVNEDLLLRIFLALYEVFDCANNQEDIDSCYQQIDDSVSSIREFQYHEKKSIANRAQVFINKFIDKIDDNEYDDDDAPLFNF